MIEIVEPSLSQLTAMGVQLHGVIHVGANDGAEVPWYQAQRCRPIICFEPHPAALARAAERFNGVPDVYFIGCALGREGGTIEMTVPADGDDEKFSRYAPIPTQGHEWTTVPPGERIARPVMRFDDWVEASGISMSSINALVIDAQGMEMEVLEGFGHQLNWITYLAVEMSAQPVYEGEVAAPEIVRWLDERGFRRLTEVQEHDDVLFIRKGVGL